tara:strand:+ start:3414 stop:3701 length:288 start_codon:yes stop_codon:yes gene_type:complete
MAIENNNSLSNMNLTPIQSNPINTTPKFEPHFMYDSKGVGYRANTLQDHLKYEALGYTHDKPVKPDQFTPALSQSSEFNTLFMLILGLTLIGFLR